MVLGVIPYVTEKAPANKFRKFRISTEVLNSVYPRKFLTTLNRS